MKTIKPIIAIIAIVLIWVSHPANAITGFQKSNTWSVKFGGTEQDIAYSAVATNDRGCVVSGSTYSFGAGRMDAWLMKLGPKGSKVWEHTYGRNREDAGYAVVQTTDGGFVTAGITMISHIWFLKVDKDGNTLWEKRINGSNNEIRSLYALQDGGIVAAGNWTDLGKKRFYVVKLDAAGNEIWAVRNDEYTCVNAVSVLQTPDGSIFAVGNTFSMSDRPQTVIVKIAPDGKQIWKRYADEFTVTGLSNAGPGDIFMSGYRVEKRKPMDKLVSMFIKLDADGNEVWRKTPLSGDVIPKAILATDTGEYLVAGLTVIDINNPEADVLIAKIDSNADAALWTKVYGGNQDDSANSIAPMNDQTYVISGYSKSESAGDKDLWIFTIDENGICNECPTK